MSSDNITIDKRIGGTFGGGIDKPEEIFKSLKDRAIWVNDEPLLISEYLGAGNMAVVVRAVHEAGKNKGKNVAIKLLAPELSSKGKYLDRFIAEAEAMKSLPQHPNIVGYYFSGMDERTKLHWLGLEFIPGTSLDKMKKPLAVKEALNIGKHIAQGLVVAHGKEIIHRDLKPGNILIHENGTAKLSDFGLARDVGEVRKTVIGEVLGTPLYMAPEQLRNRDNFSSDIHGVGAILYECLTGRPPYLGNTPADVFALIDDHNIEPIPPREFNSSVSLELDSLVLRALAKDFKHRFFNAEELLEELNTIPIVEEPSSEERLQIEEYRRLEKEKIIAKWKGVDISKVSFDAQLKFVTDCRRLLRVTVQSPDTVLDRIGWLENMIVGWSSLVEEDLSRSQKLLSAQYMLAWEENRREKWGIDKPVPPKTFMEKHGKKVIYGTIVSLVLALAATISGFVGYDHHQKAEKRREKERLILRYNENYNSLERKIEIFDFDPVDSGLKELRSIAGEDSGLKSRVDDLDARAKKARVEKEFADLYSASKKKVDSASEKVDRSSDKGARLEDKNKLLVEALALIEEVKKEERTLKREHADELRERTVGLEKKIGDKLPALKQYGSVLEKYSEADRQYSDWRAQLNNGNFFDRVPISNLQEELSYYTGLLRLDKIKKHFIDDPAYGELIRNIQICEKRLTTLERDLSVFRSDAAKKALADLVEASSWVSRNYFLEDAEKRVSSADAVILTIDEHLKNVNDIYIGERSMETFVKNFESARSSYQSAKKRVEEVSVLRKKASEGDEASILALGRLFFDNGLQTDSKPYFERIKSEDLMKTAGIYLEIISLEAEIAKPESKSYRSLNGYNSDLLASFRQAIDSYDGLNERAVFDNLKIARSEAKIEVDIDALGELHEAAYIAVTHNGDVESTKKAVLDLLNKYYQKADEELQKQEAVVRPELLERRAKLYESVKNK